MPTRAAAKRAAAALQQHGDAASVSSPPVIPGGKHITLETMPDYESCEIGLSPQTVARQSQRPIPSSKRKERPVSSRMKVKAEPVVDGWDVLPHGLGAKNDLLEGHKTTKDENDDGRPNKRRKYVSAVKQSQNDENVKDGLDRIELKAEEKRPRVRTLEEAPVINITKEVLDKVDDLIEASGKEPKRGRRKVNKYGLTPGFSPFPDFERPTTEECEEVTRLLSELHGQVKAPDIIPPPSMEVTGCGEVPDLLDAILRTLLSASTTAHNSNMALQGLKEKFGLRTSGIGKGSVNWEAVHQASLDQVIESIKKGGLAKVKGTNIKKILGAVHEQNCKRRDALLREKETGEPADVLGATHESQRGKDLEIKKANDNLLSMDHVFEMTTEEAMEEMTKLPGIGVKTASCVILFCMKRPSFAVDTHVWRHCKWLGWVPQKATRDQTFSHCEVRIPNHLKYPLHQLFLRHGKTCGRCRANTHAGTEEWNKTNCPIDHLVTRREGKKSGGVKLVKTKSLGGNKKVKRKQGNFRKESDDENSEISDNSTDHDGVNGFDEAENGGD